LFVAVDTAGKPREVQPFVPQTPVQKKEWENALLRREYRLRQREEASQLSLLMKNQPEGR
jgi:acyl-CoA hydrolase